LLGKGTIAVNLPIIIATGAYAPLLGGTAHFNGSFSLMFTGASPLYPLDVSADLFNWGDAYMGGTLTATPPT
jgi:hypothetical protein